MTRPLTDAEILDRASVLHPDDVNAALGRPRIIGGHPAPFAPSSAEIDAARDLVAAKIRR